MIPVALNSTARASYTEGLHTTLSAAQRLAALPQLPIRLLALNATFYLDAYLPTARYHVALQAALQAAASERQSWRGLSPGTPHGRAALAQLERSGASRPALYRWLFEQAVASGQPQRLLLAQHACEIAEVLDDQSLLAALDVGLLALPVAPVAPSAPLAPSVIPPAAALIEALSRALLCRRIDAATFGEQLLTLHAANRARELTDLSFSAPLALAARPIVPLLSDAAMQHVPRRLRVTQPCELAQRALDADSPGLAVLAVEAGLVEAETLSSGQQLLLLAALDRLLAG